MTDHSFAPLVRDTRTALSTAAADPNVTFRVSSRQSVGLRSDVRIRRFEVRVDEPPTLGGADSAPSPVEYALLALATCQEITYRLHADHLGIPLDGVSVSLEGDLDLRGFFGVDLSVRPGFTDIRGTVTLDSPAPLSELERFKAHVDALCPVLDLLSNATPLAIQLVAPAGVTAAQVRQGTRTEGGADEGEARLPGGTGRRNEARLGGLPRRALRRRGCVPWLVDEDGGMDLRPVSDADVPFLAEMTLLAAFPPGALPDRASEMPHATRWTTDWGRERDVGVVAWADGVRVGAAWCRVQSDVLARDEAGGPLPPIAVAVESQHRSHGVGAELLAALEGEAATAGFAGLCLAVNEQNPALRLYVRAGFETTARDSARLTMVKRLAGQGR